MTYTLLKTLIVSNADLELLQPKFKDLNIHIVSCGELLNAVKLHMIGSEEAFGRLKKICIKHNMTDAL